MAIYKITSLNYITAGNNRLFLNMDTILDYELCKPVYILRNENPYIAENAVDLYTNIDNISENWNYLSDILSSFKTLENITDNWGSLSDAVSSTILDDMINKMKESPLSVLCSDIVTEQKTGNWLKTDFLAKESNDENIDANAVSLISSSSDILLNEQ
jgi:hypothetical protein